MIYTILKKSPFRYPAERYFNVIRRGYKDYNLNKKHLNKALIL